MRLGPSARSRAQAAGAAARRCPGGCSTGSRPRGVEQLADGLPLGSAAISATNGKTTTCAMVAAILDPPIRLCWNAAGANLLSGIAAALVDGAGGGAPAELGLFECDEAALPRIVRRVRPHTLALGNLFRDQLDRYGELEAVAERWRAMLAELPPETTVIACADDPLTADITSGHARCVSYGIDDRELARGPLAHAADSRFCVRCGTPYEYGAVWFGHLGDYRCPELRTRAAGARDRRVEDRPARARGGLVRAAHAGRHPHGRARGARALQRRERPRSERRRPRARSIARRDRRRARALPPRLRTLPADRARGPRGRDAADQEPGRRERGRSRRSRAAPATTCTR